MRPEDLTGREPTLLIEDYLAGHTKAWGMFQDRSGNVRRQFEVGIEGTWDGRTLTLVEDFVYDDGETERKVWTITKLDDNTYEGVADGVIGKAYGNALNWNYRFALAAETRTWHVTFDDWFFLQPGGVLINRAEVTKFGFKVGEVTLVFVKSDAMASDAIASGQVAASLRY